MIKYKHRPYYAPIRFALVFISLFLVFYYINIGFFSLTSHGRHYNAFLAAHFNYIHWLRYALLHLSAGILKTIGFTAITNEYQLLVVGRGVIHLVYSCLGLGLMSFFAAFVLAYPSAGSGKYWFLGSGLVVIQLLNVLRFVLLSLYWDGHRQRIADHHTIFNIIMYLLIIISLYIWIKKATPVTSVHEN